MERPIRYNGQVVFYYSPDLYIGMMDCGATDDDFFNASMESFSTKATKSHGESNLIRFAKFIGTIKKTKKEIHSKHSGKVNEYWQERIDKIKAQLTPNIPAGQITVLMDEPERGLDIDHQIEMGKLIGLMMKDNYQIIMSTHSFVLYHYLKKLSANVIELSADYKTAMEAVLSLIT